MSITRNEVGGGTPLATSQPNQCQRNVNSNIMTHIPEGKEICCSRCVVYQARLVPRLRDDVQMISRIMICIAPQRYKPRVPIFKDSNKTPFWTPFPTGRVL